MNITFVRVPYDVLFNVGLPAYHLAYASLSAVLKHNCNGVQVRLIDGDTMPFKAFQQKPMQRLLSRFETSRIRSSRSIGVFESVYQDPDSPVWQELVTKVMESKPDVVGIGCYSMFMTGIKILCDSIKQKKPDTWIVLGGPHATLLPKDTLEQIPSADVCVIGDGWYALLELVEGLKGASLDLSRIKGIAYRQNGSVTFSSPRPLLMNLDEIPFADRFLGDPDDYYYGQWLYTSIGCPWHCGMCAANELGGGKVRFRSMDNVVAELKYLNSLGVKVFRFCDEALTASKKKVMEFCSGVKDAGIKDLLFLINARVDTLDKEIIDSLRDIGTCELVLGVESGSPRILEIMDKGITREQVIDAFKMLKKSGLMTYASFMIGNPTETVDDVHATVALYDEIKPTRAFLCVATPYPGTPYWRYAEEKGLHYDMSNYYKLHTHLTLGNNLSAMSDAELAREYEHFLRKTERRERIYRFRRGLQLLKRHPGKFPRIALRALLGSKA